MLIFAIPLKGKGSSTNWNRVQENLNNTIESVFNQKDSLNFKCIIACSDIPLVKKEYGNRLEILKLDLPVPKSHEEGVKDKWYKLSVIACRARAIIEDDLINEDSIYFMPLDADDLVNNKIVKYCDEFPNENGFISKYGYVYNEGSHYIKKYKDLFKFCGSCNIINIQKNDLPRRVPPFDEFTYEPNKYIYHVNHGLIPDYYKNEGKEFSIIPFPTTIYMLGTGENFSNYDPIVMANRDYKSMSFRYFVRLLIHGIKTMLFSLHRYRFVNSRFKRDFKLKT